MTTPFNRKLNEALLGARIDESEDGDITGGEGGVEVIRTPWGFDAAIEVSQGDGWKIKTPWGYIDYRHLDEDGVNEIWWVESRKRGHGSQLVDLMQAQHPAGVIAWGATSQAGEGLMRKWHAAHPDVECYTGVHEGQFDPFAHDQDEDDDDYPEEDEWDD